MDDKTIQRKLEQIAKLARKLNAEAKARYGSEAQLFMEPESGLHIMAYDNGGTSDERQEGVRFYTKTACPIEAGAW